MATTILMTDDLDGSTADSTVAFGMEGARYEIDLSRQNLAAFRKLMAPYLAAARNQDAPARPSRSERVAAATQHKKELTAIRSWARINNVVVAPQGRIPASVYAAYESARS